MCVAVCCGVVVAVVAVGGWYSWCVFLDVVVVFAVVHGGGVGVVFAVVVVDVGVNGVASVGIAVVAGVVVVIVAMIAVGVAIDVAVVVAIVCCRL